MLFRSNDAGTHSFENPSLCKIFICFTTVLFPDSPAPGDMQKGEREGGRAGKNNRRERERREGEREGKKKGERREGGRNRFLSGSN